MNIMRVRMMVMMMLMRGGDSSVATMSTGVMTVMRLLRLLLLVIIMLRVSECRMTANGSARSGRRVNYVPRGRNGEPRRFCETKHS